MSTLYQIQNRYKFTNILIIGTALTIAIFWAVEFYYSLHTVSQQQQQYIASYQEQLTDTKAAEFRILFHEIYQSARTISLLPMVRDFKGDNRTSEEEDVVSEGRLSVDAHRTLQQIYTNLENNVSVSEVYYVLDGFDPEKNIPVFMYDNLIAGINEPESGITEQDDIPVEVEEKEYAYFPQQLAWFRTNAPDYLWSHSLDQIPVRLSPLLRTCDNAQYKSIKQGRVYDSYGLIYALPVYSIDEGYFHGMITVVLRANVLEAHLIGVPFLPITEKDIARQKQEGWTMPEISMFQLIQDDNGIAISDRRNQLFAEDDGKMLVDGRWLEKEYELTTGIEWKLKHYLTPSAIASISFPYIEHRQRIIVSRILIAGVISSIVIWIGFNLSRSRNKLMQMAYFDNLTGLPNRINLFDCMQHRIKRSKQENIEFSVMIINISNFGAVNQSYGHVVGDELLTEFSHRLSNVLVGSSNNAVKGQVDSSIKTFVARLSGDEFAVVSTIIVTEYDIAKTVQAIRQVMSNAFVLQMNIEIGVNVNIGACIFPHDADSTSRLLACADTALQECRRQHGSNYYLFNNELRLRFDRLNRLSEDLKFALKRQQFEIMYQPKQSLVDGHMVSLEALLRWRHPELGYISPLEFIPILEHSNDIIEVGEWVLDNACKDVVILDQHGFGATCISVNVSVCQLRTDNYHLDVGSVLAANLTDPKRIILEITESMMMEDLEDSFLILNQLKSLGLSLAIDDFGTGYSSLTYLKNLPLSYLKLDKAFIDGMVNDRTFHIVKTVIQLAKGLDLKTIAEGIETVEQRDGLKALGCDIIQGYLLSKPKPLIEIIEWMISQQTTNK